LAAGEEQVVISLGRGEFEAAADVILHGNDLPSLGYTFTLARHTLSLAYQSLAIATLPNLLAVAVGAIWGLNPVAAAAINGGSAILAELNSLRSLKPME
jgi:cation transport ATPase